MSEDKWFWWAGRDEEWMGVGPCTSREDAIADGRIEYGDDGDSFVVLEGKHQEVRLYATTVIDNAYEHWADDSDLFSPEHDPPEPQGTEEDQQAAENELQVLLDDWVNKWRHIFPKPNLFGKTRNCETILAKQDTPNV